MHTRKEESRQLGGAPAFETLQKVVRNETEDTAGLVPIQYVGNSPPNWLNYEHARCMCDAHPKTIERWVRLGAPEKAFAREKDLGRIDGLIRACLISVDRNRFYPDLEGRIAALVLPVFHWGDCVDHLAIHMHHPERFWLRAGNVIALGEDLADAWGDEPMHVYKSPLNWIRAGGNGICFVDGTLDDRTLFLRRFRRLIPDHFDGDPAAVEHGQELRALLRRPIGPLPEILIERPGGVS